MSPADAVEGSTVKKFHSMDDLIAFYHAEPLPVGDSLTLTESISRDMASAIAEWPPLLPAPRVTIPDIHHYENLPFSFTRFPTRPLRPSLPHVPEPEAIYGADESLYISTPGRPDKAKNISAATVFKYTFVVPFDRSFLTYLLDRMHNGRPHPSVNILFNYYLALCTGYHSTILFSQFHHQSTRILFVSSSLSLLLGWGFCWHLYMQTLVS